MTKLTIKNFGPIKTALVELKKFNVIIGPQSSGKSCILKLASFCKWLEKRIVLSQEVEEFLNADRIEEELFKFHKLSGFAKIDTVIDYDSNYMQFTIAYKDGQPNFTHKWKSKRRWKYKCPAIAYIPAERNIVAVISNWFDVKFERNNILSYMADWEEARKMFPIGNNLPILDLGTTYYYNQNNKSDSIVVDEKGQTIEFTNASSGLQSVVPICVLISYLANKKAYKAGVMSISNTREREELKMKIEQSVEFKPNLNVYDIVNNLSIPQHVDLCLEEPEENIFPSTQYQLVKWIAQQINASPESSISITTHSPYILSSINNLLQASDVANTAKTDKILGAGVAIDYDSVSVYAIENGKCKSIKDSEHRLIAQSSLDAASDDISDDFSKLLELMPTE